jgi:pSer/pThr/pTyr-binding forkhead associated (FHA) protein
METDLETILEVNATQTKNIGRQDDNDYVIEYEGVSRRHCKVYYDNEHGWMITEHADAPAMSGTWLHPKNYFKAKAAIENSAPVLMHDGMQIKAHTYLFKFNISQ